MLLSWILWFATLLLLLLGGIIYNQRRRFEAETAELKSEHFEREKQQQKLVKQTEEELLISIKEALLKATQKNQSIDQMQSEIKKIVKMLEQDTLLDDNWEQ